MSKQVLDVQQMQHLRELGLELDYDTLYRYVKIEDTEWLLKPFSDWNIIGISFEYIPAYTLQDTIELLPSLIRIKDVDYWLEMDKSNLTDEKDAYYVMYVDFKYNRLVYFGRRESHSLIDEVYEMLCWCIENGHVKTNKSK